MENINTGIKDSVSNQEICTKASHAAALILGIANKGPKTSIVSPQNIVANLGETLSVT